VRECVCVAVLGGPGALRCEPVVGSAVREACAAHHPPKAANRPRGSPTKSEYAFVAMGQAAEKRE
jgi:hypothetical protein